MFAGHEKKLNSVSVKEVFILEQGQIITERELVSQGERVEGS